MNRLVRREISNIVSDELKSKYKAATGIEITDSFISALYNEYTAKNKLAGLLNDKTNPSSVEQLINERLNGIADNWHKSNFLHNIEDNNGYFLDGELLDIRPEIVAEYQHRVGIIIDAGSDLDKWLRQAIELSLKVEERGVVILTSKEKSTFINEYMMIKIRRFRLDEEY